MIFQRTARVKKTGFMVLMIFSIHVFLPPRPSPCPHHQSPHCDSHHSIRVLLPPPRCPCRPRARRRSKTGPRILWRSNKTFEAVVLIRLIVCCVESFLMVLEAFGSATEPNKQSPLVFPKSWKTWMFIISGVSGSTHSFYFSLKQAFCLHECLRRTFVPQK